VSRRRSPISLGRARAEAAPDAEPREAAACRTEEHVSDEQGERAGERPAGQVDTPPRHPQADPGRRAHGGLAAVDPPQEALDLRCDALGPLLGEPVSAFERDEPRLWDDAGVLARGRRAPPGIVEAVEDRDRCGHGREARTRRTQVRLPQAARRTEANDRVQQTEVGHRRVDPAQQRIDEPVDQAIQVVAAEQHQLLNPGRARAHERADPAGSAPGQRERHAPAAQARWTLPVPGSITP
jgi:hypothetical protein